MVFPVQAGREVLQEAPNRMFEVLLGAIDAAQAQPTHTHSPGTRCLEARQPEDDVLDVIDTYGDRARLPSSVSECSDSGEVVGTGQTKPQSVFLKEIESVNGVGMNATSQLSCQRSRDGVSPKGRRGRQFDARKERAAERKAKTERVRRQQELERLKRAKKQADEALEEKKESICMQHEDRRSAQVDRHIR